MEISPEMLSTLNNELTKTVAKNSYTFVVDKVKQFKTSKDKDEIIRNYEELVNELLEEKGQLELIAKSYKDLYERMEIGEEDLQHLQNTVSQIVSIFIEMEHDPIKKAVTEKTFDPLVQLVNSDTLRTMQLLGFNYKKAIGEPLTEVCYEKVKGLAGGKSKSKSTKK